MKKSLLLALSLMAGAYTTTHAQTTLAAKSVGPVAGPAITFEEVKYDFGSVVAGGTVDHTFKFKNTGTAPLIISNIGVSCGCTTPEWTKAPVLPGKIGTIAAHFNSTGKMGMQNKVLTIESNAAAGSTTVSLVGEVKEASATANAAPAMTTSGDVKMKDDGNKTKIKGDAGKMKAKSKN